MKVLRDPYAMSPCLPNPRYRPEADERVDTANGILVAKARAIAEETRRRERAAKEG